MDYDAIRGELTGPAVLVMTPFGPDYHLNLEALGRNIRHIVEGGVSRGRGFVICPSGTGEYNTLSREEHAAVVEAAVDAAQGEIEVVAGVASSSHFEVIARCNRALELGARVAMVPPQYYYHGMDRDDTCRWYSEIAGQTEIGLMVYDQTWRGLGGSVDCEATDRLAELPSVVSVKRGFAPSFQDYVQTLDRFADRLAFVDNSYGHTAALAHQHGATSYITGVAAFWPQGEAQFWSLLEAGRYPEAERFHSRQADFWRLVDDDFAGYATGVLKAAAEYAGIDAGSVRPPFRDLNDAERLRLAEILRELGVPEAVGG